MDGLEALVVRVRHYADGDDVQIVFAYPGDLRAREDESNYFAQSEASLAYTLCTNIRLAS